LPGIGGWEDFTDVFFAISFDLFPGDYVCTDLFRENNTAKPMRPWILNGSLSMKKPRAQANNSNTNQINGIVFIV
jgi:hypothetical protein